MKLHIIHTNDLHNHFPEKTIHQILQKDSLLFDSGDAIQGSNLIYHFKEPILHKMKKMGYTAMAMGNREFHYLRGCLKKRFQESSFPILAANLLDLTGKTKMQDSFIYQKNGIKIGIFGLTVPQYPVGSKWEKVTGWRFLPAVESTKKTVKALYDAKVDLVVCLSHSGFSTDCALAEQVPGIDLILGGHSHTVLKEPQLVRSSIILQTGSHGRFIGSWNLSSDRQNGKYEPWKIEGGLISGII